MQQYLSSFSTFFFSINALVWTNAKKIGDYTFTLKWVDGTGILESPKTSWKYFYNIVNYCVQLADIKS